MRALLKEINLCLGDPLWLRSSYASERYELTLVRYIQNSLQATSSNSASAATPTPSAAFTFSASPTKPTNPILPTEPTNNMVNIVPVISFELRNLPLSNSPENELALLAGEVGITHSALIFTFSPSQWLVSGSEHTASSPLQLKAVELLESLYAFMSSQAYVVKKSED